MGAMAILASRCAQIMFRQGLTMDAGAKTVGLPLMAGGADYRFGGQVIIRMGFLDVRMTSNAGIGSMGRQLEPGFVHIHGNPFPC